MTSYRQLYVRYLFPVLICWLALLGCFTIALMSKDLSTFSIDCKVYYMAAATLMNGKDPYNPADMTQTSMVRDPKGVIVGSGPESTVNIPLSIALFTPLALVKWRTASLFVFATNLLCIPLIFILTAKIFGESLTFIKLFALCLIAAIFPPVWKDVFVGQIALLVLAAQLAACLLLGGGYPLALFALLTFASSKITCSIPGFIVSLARGKHRDRVAAVLSVMAFIVVNSLIVLHIGFHGFREHYSLNNTAVFGRNACNDAYTYARLVRIDDAPILAMFVDRDSLSFFSLLLAGLLALPIVALLINRVRSVGVLIVSTLLYALTVVYHRPYDAIFALPLIYVTIQGFIGGRKATASLRLASLAAAFLVFGDHNIFTFHESALGCLDQPYIRPVITICMYLTMVIPEIIWANRDCRSGEYKVDRGINPNELLP
jgi:hypothetical protein